MNKLKFETDNATHGLTLARGFAWHTKEGLMFEYQVSDSIMELLKSELKELFVPYSQVQQISHKNSWFSGGTVYVQLSSLKNLEDAPFLEQTELCLELERKHKTAGKEFAVSAQLELSNYKFDQMDEVG
jgi:hypothetical protein